MQQKEQAGWEAWRPGFRPALPGLARVVGHRGARAHAPENTLAGIRKAKALGAGWVEFDVMLTRDGVPVLLHDDTLERTTGHKGALADVTLRELAGIDAGSRFSDAYQGEPIPTLEETIRLLQSENIAANVEIKPSLHRDAETGRIVAQMLINLWPDEGPRLLVSSFSTTALAAARQVAPSLPYGLLVEQIPLDWAHQMTTLGCTTLHPDHATTSPEQVRALVAEGVPVLLYTVNEPARARSFLEAGAAAIITDVPDKILAVVT